MKALDQQALLTFINEHIDTFHNARLNRLSKIKLREILKKKNPYLFKAKNLVTPDALISSMLDAFLSSSEEELFGQFLESVAIFVSEQTCGGRKSSGEGIDLEFDDDGTRYLVAIKSGVHWGNSSQQKKLRENFQRAVAVQKQARSSLKIQPVLGCCYGNAKDTDNGLYIRKVGQSFWSFISGNQQLYLSLIEPIGYQATLHNEHFAQGRLALQTRLVEEFSKDFCFPDGEIDWKRLIQFNSANME
jgi:hypothetical protein